MLNETGKRIVYLDGDTLKYMFLTYTGQRTYPVMRRLFSVLHDGYVADQLVVPLAVDLVAPYIENNKIDPAFIAMMGELGQVHYHQRFNIRVLQFISVVGYFFGNHADRPGWRDAFSSDPGEKYRYGFNRYSSITAMNVSQAVARERAHSRMLQFIESCKMKMSDAEIAAEHFGSLWEEFADLIKPALPIVGTPESHLAEFLSNEEIKEIPEFKIFSAVLTPMFEAYGIEHVERGLRDEELLAVENIAAYLPYCHYYVTEVDIAELLNMSDIPETYGVRVYDHNESSLYRFIQDITDYLKSDAARKKDLAQKTVFRRGGV